MASVTVSVPQPLLTEKIENTPVVESVSNMVLTVNADSVAAAESLAKRENSSVEGYVREYFSDTPILAEVAKCESQFRQFDKTGAVIRGVQVYEDVGVMQINEGYHKATALKLGYNIYTLEGNLSYAKWLYEKQGIQPWSASKPCWKKTLAV